jgi:hypothetical protein
MTLAVQLFVGFARAKPGSAHPRSPAGQLSAQGVRGNEVRKDFLAVDLDDWNQFPKPCLELRVTVDGDLLDLEAEFLL